MPKTSQHTSLKRLEGQLRPTLAGLSCFFKENYEQVLLFNCSETSYWCIASSCSFKTSAFNSFQLSCMSRTHYNLPQVLSAVVGCPEHEVTSSKFFLFKGTRRLPNILMLGFACDKIHQFRINSKTHTSSNSKRPLKSLPSRMIMSSRCGKECVCCVADL